MSEKICEICKNRIEESEETVLCPDCGRKFHSKCWRVTGCCVDSECRQKASERKEAERKKKQEEIAAEKAKSEAAIKKCPKCGKTINSDEEFCGKCGTKFEEKTKKEVKKETKEIICLNCGRKMEPDEKICPDCGMQYGEETDKSTKPKSKKKSRIILIVFMTVTFLIIVITGFMIYRTVHTYEKVEVIKEATCTEDGYAEYKCTICGETKTEKIPAGHNWIDATCEKPQTCSKCGEKVGKPISHEYTQCKCIFCGRGIPMMTYKGIKLPKMPFVDGNVAFLSVDGLRADEDIHIRVRNDGTDYYGHNAKEIYYKLYTTDGTVLTSSYTLMDEISVGETTIIQFSLHNTNYHVKKILLSTTPFD